MQSFNIAVCLCCVCLRWLVHGSLSLSLKYTVAGHAMRRPFLFIYTMLLQIWKFNDKIFNMKYKLILIQVSWKLKLYFTRKYYIYNHKCMNVGDYLTRLSCSFCPVPVRYVFWSLFCFTGFDLPNETLPATTHGSVKSNIFV